MVMSRGLGDVYKRQVQSLDRLRHWGDMRDDSADSLPVFSAGGPCEQFWHGQICPLFDVVHPAFPLPTTASPTLHSALRNGSGEAVTTCDMSNPCKFLSLVQSTNHYFTKLTSVYSPVYLSIASDDHLTSDMLLAAAVVAVPMRKLCAMSCFGGKKVQDKLGGGLC